MLQPRSTARPVAWGDWARLVVASLARVAVLIVFGGLFWATAPAALAWTPTTVMSDSMAPRFFAGDVVVAAPASRTAIAVGRVLLVDDPDVAAGEAPRLRLHRMVGMADDGIITKGDANAADDSSHIAEENVRGVAVLRIPFVGGPVLWAKDGHWPLVVVVGAAFIGLLRLTALDSRLRRDFERQTRRIAPAALDGYPRERTRGLLRNQFGPAAVLSGSACVVALALVISTGSHAAYASTTISPTSGWTGAADFACWPTTTPADSPYLYYRFNEPVSSSTATDSSVNGRSGSFIGVNRTPGSCPSTGSSPSIALSNVDTSQVVPGVASAIPAPTIFSLETWFQSTTPGGRLMGFGTSKSGVSTKYDRHLYLNPTGQIVFGVYGVGRRLLISPSSLTDGKWHHVVASLDPVAGTKLYVDGAQVAADPTVTYGEATTGWWRIGYDSLNGWSGTPYGFTGNLDNVGIYNTVLTAAQVSAHYALGH